HDGLGGQLVSILSLSETGKGEESKEIVKACQRALTDLRLMLNSLEDVGNDLSLMLGMFRERIEPQLRAARIALDWRLSPLPEVTGLTPSVTLTIFRILQEAVTNVMRHSGCTRVAIVAQPLLQDGYAVRLIVRDNGHGGAARRPGSRGLLNMEERSAAINARFTIESTEEGTSVLIDLPSSIPPSSS
ncbi:MAG TPA: ATP-binding protein, partial [Kiloniellales bacterium]|nr:ATP-binding protein [Kiloniellales bacterium]